MAEISKIAKMSPEEQKEWDLKLRKIDAEIEKLRAETSNLISENRYYPLIIGSTATLAIVAIAKLFL